MSKPYYEFFSPVKILAGHRALEHLGHELAIHGVAAPLVVTDRGVREAGLTDQVTAALEASGIQTRAIHDDVPQDSSTRTVADIAERYRSCGADCLIAVGGGSVIDTAKGVNILVSEGGSDFREYSGDGVVKRPLKPFFVIPTTAGTGSEVTSVTIIKCSDTGVKLPSRSQFLLPDAAVLDPRITQGLPKSITAATAMDALTHATEAYLCLGKNPISDAYATAAIRKISANLAAVLEDPSSLDGRLELAQAATMAGIAFSNSMVGVVHALGHCVGARCGVPHGVCMGVLLPFAQAHNLEARRTEIGELLLPLTDTDTYAATPPATRAEAAIARIQDLKARAHELAGFPRTLSETGKVGREDLPHIADSAIDDGALLMNPVEVTRDEALAILESAY
jgi:alcohol dehydrogenase